MYKEPKMEKLTINLPPVDLGKIDILIESGVYPSRTEFIRAAVRKTLEANESIINQQIDAFEKEHKEGITDKADKGLYMNHFGIGVLNLSPSTFEKALVNKKKIRIFIIGLVSISKKVTTEMIENTVDRVRIYGVLRASKQVREALKRIGTEE